MTIEFNCLTEGRSINPDDYSCFDLVAFTEDDGDITVVYEGDYDGLSLYGRLLDGEVEPLHDFDQGTSPERASEQAKIVSIWYGLPVVSYLDLIIQGSD